MCIESLCQACETTLNMENATLSPSYYYDSLSVFIKQFTKNSSLKSNDLMEFFFPKR